MTPIHLEEGDLVAGSFRVLYLIGEGTEARVYEAEQVQLRRRVALKVLEGSWSRFEQGIRDAASLRHPRAMEIYDFGQERGMLYLAMERLEGFFTLRELAGVELRPLPPVHLIRMAQQIVEVLARAASVGVVHGDLRPEQVFVRLEPREGLSVVVSDFCLGLLAGGPQGQRPPHYRAPEVIRGEPPESPADVYALGCVLYELVTGRPPFVDEPDFDVSVQQLLKIPRPMVEARPGRPIPAGLDRLVLDMLDKDPRKRPRTEEILALLGQIQEAMANVDRSHHEAALLTRRARMVPRPRPGPDRDTLVDRPMPRGGIRIGLVGLADETLSSELEKSGMTLFRPSDAEPLAGADVVYAPGVGPAHVVELVALGLPVITDTNPGDLERIGGLVEGGVFDVVSRPVTAQELVRKIWRALRKDHRRSR